MAATEPFDPSANVRELVEAEARRQDDLRLLTSERTREIVALHMQHARELREQEAKRIDAIRAVDVAAVAATRADAEARASALATQVTEQADAVRTALAAALQPIQNDIGELRKYQYEGQGGRTQTTDNRARTSNLGVILGVIAAVLTLGLGFLGIVATAIGLVLTR